MNAHMSALDTFDFILFGGSGDLALRKLLPALYYRHRDSGDTKGWRILGLGRHPLSREEYLNLALEHCRLHIAAKDFSEPAWSTFAQRLDYLRLDANNAQDYRPLSDWLKGAESRVRVFYLATEPGLFAAICTGLSAAGLVTPASRVVLEKPLGRDLASATHINEQVGAIFSETADLPHRSLPGQGDGPEPDRASLRQRAARAAVEPRLGATTCRSRLPRRSASKAAGSSTTGSALCATWCRTICCSCCASSRWNRRSASRPMRCATRSSRCCALCGRSPASDVAVRTVRGQYQRRRNRRQAGARHTCEEPGMSPGSRTETFVAIKAELDNWRWAGVPFYLRTGKRMQKRLADIVINFRSVPHPVLRAAVGESANRLVITLQPDEGLRLDLMAKVPGEGIDVQPISLDVALSQTYQTRQWDAYERLIMDVVHGKLTLFMRRDELDAAWRWLEPIQKEWEQGGPLPKPYAAGTWGPTASSTLIARDGNAWREET